MSTRILLVEDDPSILRGLEMNLAIEGYEIETEANGDAGLTRALGEPWDLLILDIMLPGADGLEILRRVRAGAKDVAVILLSARGQEIDKVVGLDLGADDYMTKPFGLAELLARIKAVLRRRSPRGEPAEDEPVEFGDVVVDRARRRVRRGNEEVALTPKEFEVLLHFLERRWRAIAPKRLVAQRG